MTHILKEEGFDNVSTESLKLVSWAADGSLRDALSILDQIIALDPSLSVENVQQILGFTGRNTAREVATALIRHDTARVVNLLEKEVVGKTEIKSFLREILTYMDELIKAKLGLLEVEEPDKKLIGEIAQEELFHLFNGLNKIAAEVLSSPFPELKLEVALLSLTARPPLVSIEKLIEGISNSGSHSAHQSNQYPVKSPNFPSSHNQNLERKTGTPSIEPRSSTLKNNPFEELKKVLVEKKPNALPIVGVMKFDSSRNQLIIKIISARQRDTLKHDPNLLPFIQQLANKYLGGARVIIEDNHQKQLRNPVEKQPFTIQDVKDSPVLKKILEKFEGRITKLIPERR